MNTALSKPHVKIAIMTALVGDRESLANPSIVHEGVDYIAFCDRFHENAGVWNQLLAPAFSEDTYFPSRRNAKVYKILPQLFVGGYDYYFWVDVSHDVAVHPGEIAERFLSDHDIAVFRHTTRSCVYEEASTVKELRYDEPSLIEQQMSYYRSVQFPQSFGLFELSAFAFRNTPLMTQFGLKWWELICRYSSRDQLSFPFVLWRLGVEPAIMPGHANGYNAEGRIGNNALIPQMRQHVGGASYV